ncbi:MAG: ECF transporter S component [Treponema sp.]|nr:ECF transporter S component [Treponema sp.]
MNITFQKKNPARTIAVIGALGALTIVLGLTNLGFIPWVSGAAITILHVPVIIAVLLEGLIPGIAVGAIFGIFSMIRAITSPTGALDPFFRNPLVSVVPRILIAVVTFLILKGLLSLIKKKKQFPKIIMYGIAAFFGSLANTVFVIGSLFLFYRKEITNLMSGAGFFVTMAGFLPQALLEAGAAVVISVAICGIILGTTRKKSNISVLDDE